jgi:integral membrane protein (TIGR01906 family)
MKKLILQLSLIILIILTILNSIFFIEILQNNDLKGIYLGKELPDDYSEKEKIHMQEVKTLTNISLSLNFLSLLSIIFLRKTKINLKTTGKALTIISILLTLGAIFFKKFFHYFHILFFNSENWLLPASSILIQTYPLIFFRDKFIILIAFLFLLGVCLIYNKKLKEISKFI